MASPVRVRAGRGRQAGSPDNGPSYHPGNEVRWMYLCILVIAHTGGDTMNGGGGARASDDMSQKKSSSAAGDDNPREAITAICEKGGREGRRCGRAVALTQEEEEKKRAESPAASTRKQWP